jgi:uncharacterized membrane protein
VGHDAFPKQAVVVLTAAGGLRSDLCCSSVSSVWVSPQAYGIPHAAIYLFLLWFFGHTLWRAKETARHAACTPGAWHAVAGNGSVHTRRDGRLVWFFAAQIVLSAVLFEFASLNAWSLFISVLNFPLLVLMFVGEYVYRMTFHRDFPHASILDAIQSFSEDAARSRSAKGH